MNTSKYIASSQQWDRHVQEYQAITSSARTGDLLTRLLAAANTARSFSTATAILDHGCGSGNASFALIEQYGNSIPPTARLLASDFSPGMVASVEAMKREPDLATNKLWQRLETHVLDAADLLAGGDKAPIKPASLSHIISNLVFMGVTDYKAAVRSAYDALDDTGMLALTSWLTLPWIDCWIYARPLAPDRDWDLSISQDWTSKESITSLLQEAGFTHVECETMDTTMPYEQMEPFLRGFVKSANPVAVNVFGGFSDEDIDKAIDMILKGVEQERQAGSVGLKADVLILTAKKSRKADS